MASTAAEAKVGSQGLFVRNATGLVRELNAFDAFNLVFSAVLIPVGITQVMGFTLQFWPHANMLASFAIATPRFLQHRDTPTPSLHPHKHQDTCRLPRPHRHLHRPDPLPAPFGHPLHGS